ncbi:MULTISPECIES: DUF2312 domain-containing protein [unclassified Candidatus Lariskella]|uniref:DUF2312 domain-containing protein n=1 Tax=unclassified Candidatus Lariskella TaxID=2632605 RepID=UPI0030D21137
MNNIVIGGISGSTLKQYIERIERLEEEKKQVTDLIKDVYAEAKSSGLDTKIMKQIIRERQMDQSKLSEQEELLDIYKRAIGMEV